MTRWLDVAVDTVTPLAMGGGETRGAQGAETLRARSMRGLLRVWTRFLVGSRKTAEDLWRLEHQMYGGVRDGVAESAVKVRVITEGAVTRKAWGVLPNGEDGPHGERARDQVRGEHGTYVRGVRYLGDLSFRNGRWLVGPGHRSVVGLRYTGGDKDHEWLLWASLWLLVHLGGAGSRSARAFGSLAVAAIPEAGATILGGVPWSLGADPSACHAAMRQALQSLSAGADTRFGKPIRRTSYGTLDATTVGVLDPAFGSAVEAQRHLGDALFAYRHHREPDTSTVLSGASEPLERPAWGLPLGMPGPGSQPIMLKPDLPKGRDRWPSPITFRVQRLDDGQCALVVVARDVPLTQAKAPGRTLRVEVDGLAGHGAVLRLLEKLEAEQWSGEGDGSRRLLRAWPP